MTKYLAELRGGPKDGWRYEFDELPDPKTWVRGPALFIRGLEGGEYALSGHIDGVAVYVWDAVLHRKAILHREGKE